MKINYLALRLARMIGGWDPESGETAHGWLKIVLGIRMLLPIEVYPTSSGTFSYMSAAPQWAWGVMLLVIGIVRIRLIWRCSDPEINEETWFRIFEWRKVMSLLGALIWIVIASLMATGNWRSLLVVLFYYVGLTNVINMLRLYGILSVVRKGE